MYKTDNHYTRQKRKPNAQYKKSINTKYKKSINTKQKRNLSEKEKISIQHRRNVIEQKKIQKTKSTIRQLLFLVIYISVCAIICLIFYAKIENIKIKIDNDKKVLKSQTSKIEALEALLSSSYDIKDIEEKALKLDMAPPALHQKKYIELPKSNKIVYEEVVEEKNIILQYIEIIRREVSNLWKKEEN